MFRVAPPSHHHLAIWYQERRSILRYIAIALDSVRSSSSICLKIRWSVSCLEHITGAKYKKPINNKKNNPPYTLYRTSSEYEPRMGGSGYDIWTPSSLGSLETYYRYNNIYSWNRNKRRKINRQAVRVNAFLFRSFFELEVRASYVSAHCHMQVISIVCRAFDQFNDPVYWLVGWAFTHAYTESYIEPKRSISVKSYTYIREHTCMFFLPCIFSD